MSDTEDDVVLPRFFKVFLSETASESLAIPMSFNEHLEDPLPRTAKLQGIGGGTWTESMKRIRQCVYFTSGWSKFAADHDLQDGEFLTFVYDGYSTFEVSVYARDGCKEIRAAVDTVELPDADSSSEEDEEDTSVDGSDGDISISEEEEEEEDPSLVGEDEEASQRIYTVDSEESESDAAVVAGLSNLEVTGYPSFTTSLKNRIYELLIPADAVKANGLTFGPKITYIDEEGTMEGARGKWADNRKFFKGWDRICRRNRLQKQDSVTCEMIHDARKRVHSIKIHVTRG
ncbi:unnamed protein product [Thlaspi arvense]|uniref:TF-B3 domain-containing protein n=1 Tax=Thlaspi arvense TaxID=13288 RepID=A0AAU9SI81_THLAR|nr:unnamed protein product [Thlaspi arvense]